MTDWLPLHQHLGDSAAVAARLVDEWVSPLVLARLSELIGVDVADVRQLVVWAAGVHDVGKASPAFAVQNADLADMMRDHGLAADPRYAVHPDRSRIRHEMVGQVAVQAWLVEKLNVPRDFARQISCVIGGHHGVPPGRPELMAVETHPDLAGTGAWSDARADVLGWASGFLGGAPAAGVIPRPAQVLLTAVVIVADWIASSELFDLEPIHAARDTIGAPDRELTEVRAGRAWKELDLPPRWRPRPIVDVAAAFQQRFGRSARPVQMAAVEAALAQEVPGMVIVEAPMGEGKTEAALLAVEALAARSGADGCFVALPTRATSDAMFGRVLSWLQAVPDIPVDVSVQLAHGTASLNDEFRGLMRRGHVREAGDCGADVGVAHQWLRGRKRGALAQFVIGTVDQVLVAALKSRHLVLRHLALAGKVVVIDEVHAYDVYMSQYLDRTLHWLGAYGAPVVLLSATLPPRRRSELLAAYESGRPTAPGEPALSDAYPLVSATGLPPRAVAASGEFRAVAVERLAPDAAGGDLDVLVELLRDRLDAGGCAVVVRNTVARVQETADRLIADFGDAQVTVAHSRFLACDRARLDADLIRRFGPPAVGVERPDVHIVVASQVVEQSLDVDFDLMVTDLAPVDLVLQRMGRLHRHRRGRRPARLAQPSCVLTGVESWDADPVRAVAGSRRVYGEHTLLRSAALLSGRGHLDLPDDIAPLVRAGYGEDVLGPEGWHEPMAKAAELDRRRAAERRDKARTFLVGVVGGPNDNLYGWIHGGVGDTAVDEARGAGQVRDGAESIEVVVVQRDIDGGLLTPDWIAHGAGVQIPLDSELPGSLARTVAACTLRLPLAMCYPGVIDGVITALERNHYTSFDRTPLLSGQLVLVLGANRAAEVAAGSATFRVAYDPRRGLLHETC